MKKILPFLAYGVGAIFLINFFKRKAAAGQNLKFELLKVSIDSERTRESLFFKVFYDVTLNMINSENASVVVRNVNLNVTANGKDLGNLEQTVNFSVPAQSTKKIIFKASFSTLGALGLVKDIVQNGLSVNVNVNGFIDTDLGRVNVDFNKNLGGSVTGNSKKKKFYYPH